MCLIAELLLQAQNFAPANCSDWGALCHIDRANPANQQSSKPAIQSSFLVTSLNQIFQELALHNHSAKVFACNGEGSLHQHPKQRSNVLTRNIYQKIRDHDLLDKRKTVTALKAGEDRAILLGLAMMVCSIMMYFLLGITLLRSYMQSVWTEETQCSLLNASITETFNCSFNCGPECWKISQYPCLQVYVNLTSSGQKLLLYHTEETMKINSECSYIPKCGKNYEESMSLVNVVMENFRKYQRFSCFYDPEGVQKNVILTKLYSSNVLFHSLFWPTCMMIGGVAIVAMVKLTQYLSLLCERIQRISR
ncbi:hypothetical protein DUI87_21139 [Hirundo rustica rustica]|uniref:KCNMB2 ball/chain domain-containing protein n=1 Tax=Hirundo rustica rustica TaxID=333673 RepID=A0A3M0K4G3_HIRRU|nr:hypothetical protein DUI87_21139 [Hirundo rustica rustica]